MHRQGSFVSLAYRGFKGVRFFVFALAKVVLYLALFLLVALAELFLRSMEVLQVVKYRDKVEQLTEVESSGVMMHGKPKCSALALRTPYLNIQMEIFPPRDQSTDASEQQDAPNEEQDAEEQETLS